MILEHGGDRTGFMEKYGREPLDFSVNISPLGMPEGAFRAASEALLHADRYPDPLCRKLRAALAAHHNVPTENIVCGAGAADLIYRLGAAVRPKRALIPVPAFSEYEKALRLRRCEIRRYYLDEKRDFRLDEGVLSALTPEIDLVFLCEPGNPAGVTTDPSLLRRILARCREHKILLAVDECFLPFVDEEKSMISELGEGGVLIFRAFTKFYAMAGLRIGYCITDESRTLLAQGLAGLGLRVVPGEANFLLFYAEDQELGEELAREGILIRDCANYEGLSSGWFRVSVRTAFENEKLLKTLRSLM